MNSVVKKLIGEIAELAAEVTSKTKHDVFVKYSGHVNAMTVEYYENGYSSLKNSISLLDLYMRVERKPLLKLKQVKRKLKKLLEDK